MFLSISDLKDVPSILYSFYDLFKQLILFVPNPFRSIFLIYIALFIIVLTYKTIRGVS